MQAKVLDAADLPSFDLLNTAQRIYRDEACHHVTLLENGCPKEV